MECSYWPDLLLGPDCVTASLLATGWATEAGLAELGERLTRVMLTANDEDRWFIKNSSVV